MLKKIFFSRSVAANGTIFSMENPYDGEIQMCSNKVTGITNGPTHFYIVITIKMLKKIFFLRTTAPHGTIFSMEHP